MKQYLIWIVSLVISNYAMDNKFLDDFIIMPKSPSITTCAQVSALTYENKITTQQLKTAHLDNYYVYMPTKHIKNPRGVGFRGIAFVNHKSKQCIVAYRGTETKEIGNLLQDIGIFFDEIHKNNPYEILHNQLNTWLWSYNKKLYAAHKIGDWTMWLGKYLLSFKSGFIGTIAQKMAAKIVNHKVLFHTLARIIGLTVTTETKGCINKAMQDANTFFNEVKEKFSNYDFYVTGHSLGGFLAQIVGAKNNTETYTFNAPGASNVFKTMYPNVQFDHNLITNIIRRNDIFGTFDTHIGTLKKLPNYLKDLSMQMSSDMFWAIYNQEQYEKTITTYWESKKSWFKKAHTPSNPYLYVAKNASGCFNVSTYIYDITSIPNYILENHSITNLVNDLTLREQYHFNF